MPLYTKGESVHIQGGYNDVGRDNSNSNPIELSPDYALRGHVKCEQEMLEDALCEARRLLVERKLSEKAAIAERSSRQSPPRKMDPLTVTDVLTQFAKGGPPITILPCSHNFDRDSKYMSSNRFSPDEAAASNNCHSNPLIRANPPSTTARISHFLFGAESALKHVTERDAEVKAVFSHRNISQSDYSVHAGFNESLIQLGVGYVQEIHIFTSAEISADSPLVVELGNLFSPYPGILFTKSFSLRTPVFKDDGSIWDFDELVLSRARPYAVHSSGGVGSGDVVPHVHSTLNDAAGASSSGSSANRGSSSGDSGGNKGSGYGGKSSQEGQGSQDRDDNSQNGDPHKENPDDDDPEEPNPDGQACIPFPHVSFDVLANVYCSGGDNASSVLFQELQINGTLTLQTNPPQLKPRQLSSTRVEFLKLKFQGQPKTKSTRYELGHLRVAIDTTTELTDVDVKKPFETLALGSEVTETNASKSAWAATIGGTLSGIFGITTATGALTTTRTKETSSSAEVKKFNSRIIQYDSRGVVWWGFSIDDPNQRERGIRLNEDTLPSVEFKFKGDEAPPPPPEFLHVEVSSCWSLISGNKNKVPSWLGLGQSTSESTAPSHSVLCQVILMQIPTRRLSESSEYVATLDMKSDYQIDVKLPGLPMVKVLPAMRCFTDPGPGESVALCDKGLLMDEVWGKGCGTT